MSLTYRETKQQYEALRRTYDYMLGERERIVRFAESHAPASMTFVGPSTFSGAALGEVFVDIEWFAIRLRDQN